MSWSAELSSKHLEALPQRSLPRTQAGVPWGCSLGFGAEDGVMSLALSIEMSVRSDKKP